MLNRSDSLIDWQFHGELVTGVLGPICQSAAWLEGIATWINTQGWSETYELLYILPVCVPALPIFPFPLILESICSFPLLFKTCISIQSYPFLYTTLNPMLYTVSQNPLWPRLSARYLLFQNELLSLAEF